MRRSNFFFLLILLPFDYSFVFLSFLVAYYLRIYLNESYVQPLPVFFNLSFLFTFFWMIGFALAGLYSFDLKRSSLEEFFGIILGSTVGIALTSATIFISKEFDFSRLILLLVGFISFFLVAFGRFLVSRIHSLLAVNGLAIQRILVVGVGEEANLVLKAFAKQGGSINKILGKIEFDKFAKTFAVFIPDEVIVADPSLSRSQLDEIFDICEEKGIKFKFVPDVFHSSPASVSASSIDGLPLIELKAASLDGWTVIFKRVIDFFISLIGLTIVSPILVLIAILIRMDSSGPVFFPHERVGRNGKKFFLYKFRSMQMIQKNGRLVHALEDREIERLKEAQPNYKLVSDPRVTRVGRLIRRTSIDELPQLWNVLKGEMSIVGPRAYIEKELEVQRQRYPETRELIRRLLTVKPGVTGIWQVSGRSNIDFSGRVAMDAYYATHASLLMDIKIILMTVPVVLRGSGAM